VADLERDYKDLGKNDVSSVDPSHIREMDTAGVWLIKKFFSGKKFSGSFGPRQKALFDFAADMPQEKDHKPAKKSPGFFVILGEKSSQSLRFVHDFFAFIGGVSMSVARNFFHLRGFRLPSIVRHIQETGFNAIPVIGLLAFGISTVIFYQGGTQLGKFGADIYTIDLTVISLLREMAVLTTAIMVAGRSGSAFAAEIGVMKLRGEVDALRTMGIDPVEALVVPRLLALFITLPLLSFLAVAVGLTGGGIMSVRMLDIEWAQYIDRVQNVATPLMFFVGMIKAPVFAFLIATICTYQGMNVSGSAENVGKTTTLAVVQSIFLVIIADAVFSIVFSIWGI
jgi:phospholipid/cholesterol/gamma-HCH transport system permease protein